MRYLSVRLTRNSWRGAMGTVVDVPPAKAAEMIADGRAVPVPDALPDLPVPRFEFQQVDVALGGSCLCSAG